MSMVYTPNMIPPVFMSTSSIETLMAKVKKQPNGCWEFHGLRDKKGYGKFYVNGSRRAHRSSWILHKGPIPVDRWVLHKCDNPPCVNPDHLFLGTHHDNMQDAIGKGRIGGFLDEEKVRLIRFLCSWGASRKKVAAKLGLSFNQVNGIATRISYKHVHDAEIPTEALLHLCRLPNK